MDSEIPSFKLKFELIEVSNKFLRQLTQTINAAKHIYHAVNNYDVDFIPPLETNTLPIAIIDPSNPDSTKPTKEQTLLWLYKKAFEEFIIGLSESLVEAYQFLKILRLAKKTETKQDMSESQLRKAIEEIKQKGLKLFFSKLIEEIESELNNELLYKTEILSINNLRNCLVHRNGVVSKKDINDEVNGVLKLIYFQSVVMVEINGKFIEATWEVRKDGIEGRIGVQLRPATLCFNESSTIHLSQDNFNDVANTCVHFSLNLLRSVQSRAFELGALVENPINQFNFNIG